MENTDLEFFQTVAFKNPEIKSLVDEHIILSKQVDKLSSKPFHTPDEAMNLKNLKKLKLDNKTLLQSRIEQL